MKVDVDGDAQLLQMSDYIKRTNAFDPNSTLLSRELAVQIATCSESKFELTRSRRGHLATKGSTQPRGANNNGSTQQRNLTNQTNENPPKHQSTPGTGPYSRSGDETSGGAAETSLSTFLLWGDERKWCETAKILCGVQCGEGEGAPYIIGTQTICPLRISYKPPRPTKYPAMIPE